MKWRNLSQHWISQPLPSRSQSKLFLPVLYFRSFRVFDVNLLLAHASSYTLTIRSLIFSGVGRIRSAGTSCPLLECATPRWLSDDMFTVHPYGSVAAH